MKVKREVPNQNRLVGNPFPGLLPFGKFPANTGDPKPISFGNISGYPPGK